MGLGTAGGSSAPVPERSGSAGSRIPGQKLAVTQPMCSQVNPPPPKPTQNKSLFLSSELMQYEL